MFFIHFNDDILLYNLLYNWSYIHKSIKILNFELISSILQISLSNNFLVYSNPMIFSDKICLDFVFNNIRKFYSFLHDQARESIPYRTGRYGRYIPYRSLKLYRNTCVSFQLYWVVPTIPDEISCFSQKNHTEPEHDFQIKRKEKFSNPVSLSSFSNILTYSFSLCYCYCQKVTAMLLESHFANLLLLPLLLLC